MSNFERNSVILFDVDGTLTQPRKIINPELYSFLTNELRKKAAIGLVGGSDLEKILEQMGGTKALEDFDFVFSENGLVSYANGKPLAKESIQNAIGEEKIQKFINFSLHYMSTITLPVKRGNFIEFRNGMINLCPVGRSCSQAEREQFFAYDLKHGIRNKFIEALEKEFPDFGLKFAIGGQISIDVFPIGWDKTFCLQFVDKFQNIYFYGDKTNPGENDYEIFKAEKTKSTTVMGPEDTKEKLVNLLQTL